MIKKAAAVLMAAAMAVSLTGCGSITSGKRIIRISHAQSETHPEHLGLLAFKEYVEERLGDKYEVQIFPNEILGSAQKAIELTQTGAIDFVVAGTANLETFADVYEIFSMPYLFDSEDVYKTVMEDSDYMEQVYESTDEAGFRVVTWYNAGTRNFYAKTPIRTPEDLKGKKILVTAGPTREAIDPVRYITNHSTGKMGYAIAEAAAYRGADVTLVTGPVSIKAPLFVKTVPAESAKQMYEAVTGAAKEQDIIIKAAAVADYRPAHQAEDKIKKSEGDMKIELERTDDILGWLGAHRREGQFLCGFSMETRDLLANSRAKLERKNIDMIVANNLKTEGAGFGTDTNVVTLITKEGQTELPKMTKQEVAHRLLDEIRNRLDFTL